MTVPKFKHIFLNLLFLALFVSFLEKDVFGLRSDTYAARVFFEYLPLTLYSGIAWHVFFYKEKSAKAFLCSIGLVYIVYIAFWLLSVDAHEYIGTRGQDSYVNDTLTPFGFCFLTFNVFLAPLVLAFNMYIFEIFFKKRFQKAAQTKTEG